MVSSADLINNIEIITPRDDTFSSEYLTVRKKEGRGLTDFEVLNLPNTTKSNKNYREWSVRKRSSERILTYLKNINKPLNILDVGCGNGWFTNCMASLENVAVTGLDINIEELSQAARVFEGENLKFIYADIFEARVIFKNKYDLITLNASIQYFEQIHELLGLLKTFLKPNGEIHIFDSPFYSNEEMDAAKKRTVAYYSLLGVPQMSDHYFHHSNTILKEATIMYSPKKGILEKIFRPKDIPFYWIKIS